MVDYRALRLQFSILSCVHIKPETCFETSKSSNEVCADISERSRVNLTVFVIKHVKFFFLYVKLFLWKML